jgi:molybdenum cofactor cytidylyltransferase
MGPHSKHLKIAMVILAAGESSRMDTIKQILPWKDTTLLGHVIKQGLASKTDDVYVVLGANAETVLSEIDQSNISIIHNHNWHKGMGTSLARAIHYFDEKFLFYDAVLVALSDQPLIDVEYFNSLLIKYIDSDKDIVATQIKQSAGVPAIFASRYFNELGKLHEDFGARKILNTNPKEVLVLNVDSNIVDIDTMDIYKELYLKYGKL